MAVEANAVAEAVREEFVVGAEAGGSDDGAGGIVDGAGEFAGASSAKSGILSFADGVRKPAEFFLLALPRMPVRVTSDS